MMVMTDAKMQQCVEHTEHIDHFNSLCARDPQLIKQQSPTVCNSCYSFADLEWKLEFWLSVLGVKPRTSCTVMHE